MRLDQRMGTRLGYRIDLELDFTRDQIRVSNRTILGNKLDYGMGLD